MKVLWNWLLELCDFDRALTVEEGAAALTRGGVEIEGMTNLGAGFSGVVVAEVVGKRPHPQADKLTLVDVITERGGAATQVVCGAPNVPDAGRKVLWAQVGATLPGGLTLAAKPVKGVVSPGMLCAEDELGLSDDHAGIVVLDADDPTALGASAQRALGIDDWLLEVNAPANRGDLLGHLGVARELCAMVRGRLVLPDTDLSAWPGGPAPALAVATADPAWSPRYTARFLDGVQVAASPRRFAARLRAVGVRPISNVVDITNYVMFELGQPLHAFDAATLVSQPSAIGVGAARDGEKLTTLDKLERTLTRDDLVIRDGARAIALAGVMGGLDTEVTGATTRILLEAASFAPAHVRRTAKRLGLHSEASHRFERSVDPELAQLASARAARLFCLFAGATPLGELVDAYPGAKPTKPIPVRMARVWSIAGAGVGTGREALNESSCSDALERLGCAVEISSGRELTVTPPSVRPDIAREIDVIEEILRVIGYDVVPATLPGLRAAPMVRERDRGDLARQALAAAGASEAITFGFQSAERCAALGLHATDPRATPIAVKNPMSEAQAVMRTSLLPNLIAAIARNASYGRADVALFEVGHVFLRRADSLGKQGAAEAGLADEPLWAAGVVTGARPAQLARGAPYDVFDAKALALVAIRAVAGDVAVTAAQARDVPYLHPGVAGSLAIDPSAPPLGGGARPAQVGALASDPVGRAVGWFGEVHPAVRARLGVDAPVFAFEVELARLPLAGAAQMRSIPKFPGSARDVSLLLAADIPAARVQSEIAAAREPLVSAIRLLEDYRGDKLGAGMKSMLWSIAYRAADRTLTDVEVDRAHEAIVARLVHALPAQRR